MKINKSMKTSMSLAVVAMACFAMTTSTNAATLWTPANITTAAWYDASDALTITAAGSSVSQWDDKSGNGIDLTGTASTVTSSIGGLNVIRFDGISTTGNRLSNTSFAVNSENLSFFYVREVVSAGSHQAFNIGRNTNTEGNIREGSNGGTGRIFGSRFPDNQGITVSSGDLDAKLVSYVKAGTNSQEVWFDGTSEGTNGSLHTTFTSERIDVGGGNSALRANYDFGEIVVVDSALSTDDRERVEGYLAWKWGLEGSLDSSHTYKLTAPTAVPEPSTTALLGLGGLALILRRRK
jgi:hypothetical protein